VNPIEIHRWREEATPDEVDMYLYCRFPKQTDRWYDRTMLWAVPKGEPFLESEPDGLPMPESGAVYAVAVDWAKEHDRTEILVADIRDNILHYRFWKRIYPKGKEYSEQRVYVKALMARLRAQWIVVDATSVQDAFVEELMRGENAIPPALFYKMKVGENAEKVGFHASSESNYEMHRNHKLNIVNGKIRIAREGQLEAIFFQDWVKQHNQLEKHPIQSGKYVKLEAPRNGYKDLAVTSAMLSLRISSLQQGPPAFYIGTF